MKHSLDKMSCLDVYLSSISTTEYETIKPKINTTSKKIMPLKSWDIHLEGFYNLLRKIKVESEMNTIQEFGEKFEWSTHVSLLFSNTDYDAIILTDAAQQIIWVNEGFSKMTGYPKTYALNKTPGFLQGKGTSTKTKSEIRQHLDAHQPFQSVIKNYKKDGTPYNCEIKIIPLYNYDEVTHYIALEKEVV